MKFHALLSKYFFAYNEHDIDKLLSFLHPDCRVVYNGQPVMQGVTEMRPAYEKDFLDSQASVTLLEYNEESNKTDRARVLLKSHDHRLLDVTYVFDTKLNTEQVADNKMVEHIIHAVNYNAS